MPDFDDDGYDWDGDHDDGGPSEQDLRDLGDEASDTVDCPVCGEAVYEFADRCPSCGSYIMARQGANGRKGPWRAVAFTALILLLVLLILLW